MCVYILCIIIIVYPSLSVNLLLTGVAVSNVFDGDMELSGILTFCSHHGVPLILL